MKTAFFACWGISALAFAAGFGIAGQWLWTPGIVGCALAWILARRRSASLCLCASVLLAACGILVSVPAAPMIAAAAASLAMWDLEAAGRGAPGHGAPGRPEAGAAWKGYWRSRLPYSLLALSLGSAAAILGFQLRVDLPFFAMLPCVAACALCIDRVLAYLLKRA